MFGARARTVRPIERAAIAVAAALSIAIAARVAAAGEAAQNLILNSELTTGGGNSPDHWRTEGWDQRPVVTTYLWNHPSGLAGDLEITNAQPNDARWMQSLSLRAGWYHVSVDARAEGVGSKETGVTISVLEDGITSEDLKGNAQWKRLGLYLKVGPRGADVELGLRLGGYASLNTGKAFFRNPSVVRIAAPPSGATHVFDLDAIRKESQTPPVGKPWTLVAVFIMLGAVATIGWRLYGDAVAQPAPVQKQVEQPKPREERAKQARKAPGRARRRTRR